MGGIMKKTRIVCTMGPACDDENILREMMLSGMNVARFNFSHGNHEEQKERIDRVKKVREELGLNIALMLDTKGPEIRIRQFETGKTTLFPGNKFTLCCYDIPGTDERVSVTYENLYNELETGNELLIDDGLVKIRVEKIEDKDIICTVIDGGELSNNKSINIPGVNILLPALTERDIEDILFGIENDMDVVAASFIRSKEDVEGIRKLLDENGGSDIMIISKIENRKGVDNLDEIIDASDGVMVARGDLGVEIPAKEVPVVQKKMIRKCNILGKPVITATQMLDSMIENPRPTRAEVGDVANAVFDGSDCVMLSGETAAGKYPVESVKTMAEVVLTAENEKYLIPHYEIASHAEISETISYSSFRTAQIIGANAILTPTTSGYTARMVAKYRPDVPVVALSSKERVLNQLMLTYGVIPVKIDELPDFESLLSACLDAVRDKGIVSEGDTVVVTAGLPVNVKGTTNTIRVEKVK